jgi:hypothetical protein
VDDALAAQLITVGATLGGVVLTLAGSALVERRRAQEARRLETVRLAAEHTKWLRDERMKAYAGFSLASEEVQHFLRFEVPALSRWHELRAALRKAYNQVQLLGGDEPRAVALRVWLLGRREADSLVRACVDVPVELADRAGEILAQLGDGTNEFLQASRADLQGG